MYRSLLVAALSAYNVCMAASPIPTDAADAAQQVTYERNVAQRVLRPGATSEQLRQGEAELEGLRALLDRQPYRDLSAGGTQLYNERFNIELALARIRARLGDKEGALRALESTTAMYLMPQAAEYLEHDADLVPIKDAPRFQAVVALHRRGAVVSHQGFASSYSMTLTREQRIAGLSLFWSEVRHNFANIDLMPQLDWDGIYLEYLSKVERADTTAEYYTVLMQLAPLLHDGHTNVYPPEQLMSHFYARMPLQTALVEDAVLVTAVHDLGLAQRIRRGDRILTIDGVDARAYAEQRVRPFVSSSTEQDRNVRMYDYQLLQGDETLPVALTLADRDGRQYTLSVPRSGWHGEPEPRFPFRMLPGGVAYLRLDHFETDAGLKAFEAAWPAIRQAKGLILDVRTNGGGSTSFGTAILAHLSDRPILPTMSRVRFEDQSMRAHLGDLVSWKPLVADAPTQVLAPDQVFKGPVVLLIGPRTFSAAEDFAAMFAQARRGALVGEATAGSTGQPLMLDLPGGGKARICVKRDTYADGSDFVGRGIQPTLAVGTTIAAIRAGQDPALEAAEAFLRAHPDGDTSRP